LDAKTAELLDKLKTGTPLADVAGAAGLAVETKWGLKRQGTEILPARAIAQIFRTPKDGVGSSDGQSPTERIIFRVTDIKDPPFDATSDAAKGIIDQLRKTYNDELLSEYVARLETEIGTSINQSALDQAVGRAAQQN
jgi:peptidyl-prolyl cis-trans isomerase D